MSKIIAWFATVLLVAASCAAARIVPVSTTAQLTAALSAAQPGDDIQLAPGVYGTGMTSFTFTKSGAAGAITVRGITAADGSHPIVKGRFNLGPGMDNYDISGIEFDGAGFPAYGQPGTAELVLLQGKNIHFHANYLHTNSGNCVSSFGSGVQSGQVIEDNVTRDCHYTAYVQNDFDNWGYKIFRHNAFLDGRDKAPPDGNNFIFHGYTQSGINSGFYLQENVLANGRVLTGGTNNKTRHEVFLGNVFYKAGPQLSYQPSNPSPSQTDDFSNNLLLKSPLDAGGTCYDCGLVSKFTHNKMWEPLGSTYGVINSLKYYNLAGVGTMPVDAGGLWDWNQYWGATLTGGIYISYWFPGGKQASGNGSGTTLAKWQSDIQNPIGGNCALCEKNSTVYTTPPYEYRLFKSNVDPGRGLLAVVDAGKTVASSIAVDLSPVVAVGSSYSLIPARLGQWGAPTLSGTYAGGNVTVPIPLEFEVYVIVPGAGAPPSPTSTPMPTSSPTPTPSAMPTVTQTPTRTWTPTPTATATATATATDTPTSTPTNTPTFTPTPTPTMGDGEQQDRIRALERVVYTPTP